MDVETARIDRRTIFQGCGDSWAIRTGKKYRGELSKNATPLTLVMVQLTGSCGQSNGVNGQENQSRRSNRTDISIF